MLTLLLGSVHSLGVTAQVAELPDYTLTYTQPIASQVQDNINIATTSLPGLANCNTASELAVTQLQQALGKIVISSAHSFGYFAAVVHDISLLTQPISDEPSAQCHAWVIDLALGNPAVIADIQLNISGDLAKSKELSTLVTQYQQTNNTPFKQAQYQSFKDSFYSQAIAQGYFDIEFLTHVVTVNADNQSVSIAMDIALGQRYTINQFSIDEAILQANVVNTVSQITPSDEYSLSALNTLTNDLKQTGFFETIRVQPDLKGRADNRININITGTEKAKHFLNLGLGVTSDDGVRASIDWRRPRINQSGHSLYAKLKVSLPEQSLSSTYKIPYGNPNTDYLALKSGLKHIDRNDSQSQSFTLAAQRFFDLKKSPLPLLSSEWQPSLFARYEYNYFSQGNTDEINSELIFIGSNMTRLRTDHPLFPTHGDRQSITFETAHDSFGSDISITRLLLSSAWLRPVSDIGWSLSKLDIKYLNSSDFGATPNTLRYYAGGDQSLRGFGFEAVSPLDAERQATGADQLLNLSQELITPINANFRLAGFVDAAWINSPSSKTNATGVGVGLHWQSPIGPVRMYIARGNNEQEMTWRFHLVMGPLL